MNLHTAKLRWRFALTVALLLAGCAGNQDGSSPSDSIDSGANSAKAQRIAAMNQVTDHHSYARPDEARITHLVKMLSASREKKSAAILEITEDSVALEVLERMKADKAGKVLAAMTPERAAELTEAIGDAALRKELQ